MKGRIEMKHKWVHLLANQDYFSAYTQFGLVKFVPIAKKIIL